MFRALLLPFRTASLLLVGLIAALLALSLDATTRLTPFGVLVPAYLLFSWFNKYAFALLDRAAHGAVEPPVASLEMLGPWGDWRALVHPPLIACVGVASWAVGGLPPALPALLLLFLPASIGVLAMTHELRATIWPPVLWHTIRGLGPHYLLLAGMVGVGVFAGLLWRLGLPSLLFWFAVELLALSFYAAIGGAIHARRLELGFEPERSP